MFMALLAAWFAAYVWMIVAAGVLLWLLTLAVDIFIIHPRSAGSADETA
jgi:membrane protein YdbS with pleckstrin-like domain